MIELNVLNGDLERIDIIDNYVSLIWSSRYNDEGDCELYVEATNKNLETLKKGNFLTRDDDDMVCRIEKIELETNRETGNYIIVTAYDIKKILSQRVIWGQTNVDGNVEDYVRDIIYHSLVNPNLSARQIKNSSGRPNFFLGDKFGFNEIITEQTTYKKVKEKVQEICKKYGWGYKVIIDETVKNFYFLLYEGTDRSDTVVFSPDYENLLSSKYIEDSLNLANVALVGGEGEGSERSRNVSGYAEGLDRNEIFVDAKDISRTIKWSNLIAMYPTTDQGGHGHIDESALEAAVYRMDIIDIAIVDNNQLTELQSNYPNGQIITKNGNRYYQTYDVIIADLPSKALTEPMQENDDVILRDLVYSVFLLNRGYEKLSEYGTVVSFDGIVEPNTTFKFKEDYFLGDKVSVENEFGISANARIVEVIEVCDDNGYSVEPKFEYIDVETSISEVSYLLAETGERLLTENNEFIELETSFSPAVLSAARDLATPNSTGSKKISELPESTDLYDGSCMPIVTNGETKKLTYELLKLKLAEELNTTTVIDSLTNEEIEALINSVAL